MHRELPPTHPGEHIREDCLLPLDLTVTSAADVLGVSRKQLDAVVNGRAGISPEMAIRLSKAFGGSAGVWLRMQTAYDLWRAEQKADRIKVRRVVPVHKAPDTAMSTGPAKAIARRRAPRRKDGTAV
jgi:addiction module HigA family antidote